MDDFGRNIHLFADSRAPWSSLTASIPVDGYTQMQAGSQAPSDGVSSAEATRRNTNPNLYDQFGEQANHLKHWNSLAVPAQRGVMNSVAEDDSTVDPRLALSGVGRGD